MISFEESGYLTGLNKEKLGEVAEYFRKLRDKYIREGLIDPKMLMPDPRALIYQVPGGMLSNMYSQLKGLGLESKYEEVLAEVPKVRKDFGYPPLVTPLSQMVGTQATMNIVTGERYKMVSKEVKDYLKGKYGKFPVPVEESFRKSLVGEEDIISHRPADDLENEFTKLNNEIGELSKNDEDTLIYALFPEVGKNFLNNYYNPKPDIIKIKAYF